MGLRMLASQRATLAHCPHHGPYKVTAHQRLFNTTGLRMAQVSILLDGPTGRKGCFFYRADS